MCRFLCLVVLFIGFSFAQSYIDLTVDTNRDGVVQKIQDDVDEDLWSKKRGAIFFYNNDSDENNHSPDCLDDKINGEKDLLDLTEIQLQSDGKNKVTLYIDANSQTKINLFVKSGSDYQKISSFPYTLAANVAKNCEMRIEATSYADAMWNGVVTVTAEIDSTEVRDVVALKVAPFILLANTQEVDTIYIRAYPGKNDTMIQQLRTIASKSSVEIKIIPANLYPYYQIWMQDTMEIGYSEGPGHWFHVVLPANRNRPLDNWSRDYMLGKDFGWFRYSQYRHQFARGGGENGWLDWYGNLEVSPPLPGYPFGRIYYGGNGTYSLNPEIVDMLDRQNVQRPLVKLDTGWLLIKHVDEILSFVPTQSGEKTFKVLVPSTQLTIDLLKKWQKEGKGNTKILERNKKNWTINSLLKNTRLIEKNVRLQSRINNLYKSIKKEFFVDEDDFIYIPALVENGESIIPNMVNSVFVNGHLLMANPNGPIVDDKDLIQEYVRHSLGKIPVHFLDDWKYHTWAGNVHCATNTVRKKLSQNWWND
ncbi:protein-arginine deiminase family protein [Candidatus Uabimicrobium sp. HlEnr_7]|uniref:protein-arginine deiminase family protein n=1 Tax=Candidatus Uabimicrobium helgolandensis TaxID=3095367 RepID=UPI00355622BC